MLRYDMCHHPGRAGSTGTWLGHSERTTAAATAAGAVTSLCNLRTCLGADLGSARQSAGKPPIVRGTAKGKAEDAAAVNEGATEIGCAAKLPSLGFALFREVSRVQRRL